ncbi:hypothetical protein KV205_14305 [Streptomyces sp. SKN60]|uniref:hypothetical protein n=1 Tax=Streptomyces sp. SKN60 TaxID=2855506 RepID=UPI002245CC7D|nr:hypothetical protein [Streptomyces sp. SKN60]MCX2181695.1 hypothetical protein [Streptomyces sp. SKN60]
MYAYELHQVRHAELVARAAAQRLAREAREAAHSRRQEPEGRVNTDRQRFARAA